VNMATRYAELTCASTCVCDSSIRRRWGLLFQGLRRLKVVKENIPVNVRQGVTEKWAFVIRRIEFQLLGACRSSAGYPREWVPCRSMGT